MKLLSILLTCLAITIGQANEETASFLCTGLENTLSVELDGELDLIGSSWFTNPQEFAEQANQLGSPIAPFQIVESGRYQDTFNFFVLQAQLLNYIVIVYAPEENPFPAYQCLYEYRQKIQGELSNARLRTSS